MFLNVVVLILWFYILAADIHVTEISLYLFSLNSKMDALLNCMKPLTNDCPETVAILQQVAFDLQSYEKGIGILCRHKDSKNTLLTTRGVY